jgi:hemerythrin-like domain-containing protein
MNITRVRDALDTIEQDHRLVLDRMQTFKDIVSCLLNEAPEAVCQTLLQLREVNKYFATEFICHMEEEEQTLFPLLEEVNSEGKEQVARLRTEHDLIRKLCQELDDSLQVALELEDGLRKAVLRDVFVYGWRLWELLDGHAHCETQAVQKCLESSLQSEINYELKSTNALSNSWYGSPSRARSAAE